MSKKHLGIKRVPSADWRTENLEDLWKNTAPVDSAEYTGSIHQFLEYCCLLRDIRKQFEIDRLAGGFDEHAFFLRGGYFAFKYLNMTTAMALRGTIFGGLNHGRHPKLEFPRFINELREKGLCMGKRNANLLVVDEVNSGTGMGTVLNLILDTMSNWSDPIGFDIRVCFYAVRTGSPNEKSKKLQATESKWQGQHATPGGLLIVDIKDFAGPLLGYDSDRLCGVKRVSDSANQTEAYEILKSVGGTIRLSCEVTGKKVFEASLGNSSLVETLSAYAVALTSNSKSAVSKNLDQQITLFGCPICRTSYAAAVEP